MSDLISRTSSAGACVQEEGAVAVREAVLAVVPGRVDTDGRKGDIGGSELVLPVKEDEERNRDSSMYVE